MPDLIGCSFTFLNIVQNLLCHVATTDVTRENRVIVHQDTYSPDAMRSTGTDRACLEKSWAVMPITKWILEGVIGMSRRRKHG